jgi:hypothetical protein
MPGVQEVSFTHIRGAELSVACYSLWSKHDNFFQGMWGGTWPRWEPLQISKYQQQFSSRTASNSRVSKEILVETRRWDMSYCSCHWKMTWSTWPRWDLGVLFVFYIQGLTQMYLSKASKLLRTLAQSSFFSLHITRSPCLLQLFSLNKGVKTA